VEDNIIYLPLDVPDVPKCQVSSVFDWCENAGADYYALPERFRVPDQFFKKFVSGQFQQTESSQIINGHRRFVTRPETGEFMSGFDKHFPDMADYIRNFPIIKPTILLLSQFGPNTQDFTLHFDGDTAFGYRVYWHTSSTEPRLWFKKLRPEFVNKDQTKSFDFQVTQLDYAVEGEKLVARMPSNAYAYLINRNLAPHAVEPPTDKDNVRISLLIYGPNHQINEHEALVAKSLKRFGDYAIHY
jgi:hypothetical protein